MYHFSWNGRKPPSTISVVSVYNLFVALSFPSCNSWIYSW